MCSGSLVLKNEGRAGSASSLLSLVSMLISNPFVRRRGSVALGFQKSIGRHVLSLGGAVRDNGVIGLVR